MKICRGNPPIWDSQNPIDSTFDYGRDVISASSRSNDETISLVDPVVLSVRKARLFTRSLLGLTVCDSISREGNHTKLGFGA